MTTKDLKRIVKEEMQLLIDESTQHKTRALRPGMISETAKRRRKKSDWKRVKQVKKTESDNERRRRIFGTEELDQLAKFIVETDQDLEEVAAGHDDSGEFTSKEKSRCDSTYFSGGTRTRKKGGKLSQPKSVYGRGKHKDSGKGSRKCKDDTKVESKNWQQLYQEFYKSYDVDTKAEPESYDEESEMTLAYDRNSGEPVAVNPTDKDEVFDCGKQKDAVGTVIKKLKDALAQMKSKNTDCVLQYEDALRILNTLELHSQQSQFGKL
jgi:hypothetical protein